MSEGGYVYILASRRHGTLYVGVTSDLTGRVWEHRNETYAGFTTRYDVKRLMWSERHSSIVAAIDREKQIKKWRRDWKVRLIETDNPEWDDLAVTMLKFDPL